jgi:sulfoquinovosidase
MYRTRLTTSDLQLAPTRMSLFYGITLSCPALRPKCLVGFALLLFLYLPSSAQEIKEYRPFEYALKTKTKFGSLKIRPKIKTYSPFKPFAASDSSQQSNPETGISFEAPTVNHGYEFSIPVDKALPIFGLGEQYSHLCLNGEKAYVITEEQGIGRGDQKLSKLTKMIGISGDEFSSYCPIPILYIGNQHALVIEDLTYAEFDFTNENEIRIKVFDNTFRILQLQAKTLPELLSSLTQRYGRMPSLPDWAFSTCFGLQGGSKKVEAILQQAQQLHHPIGSVWIQDWVGRRKTRLGSQLNWQWLVDSVSYPDFRNWIRKMNQQHIQVLGYVNPFLATEGPLTKTALENHYLVQNPKGKPYLVPTGGFKAYMLDLTNPQAVLWIKNIIKTNMVEAGLAGWMADFGEWLPLDAKLFNGMVGREYHNQYVVDWAKLNREIIRECGKEDSLLFFNRSGSLFTAKWSTMLWCGDQMVNDGKNDGMPSAINALISSGISGIQLNHADIGGYAGTDNFLIRIKRKEDLLKRWIEWSAFTPFFRTHEGLMPEKFAQVYANDTIAAFFAYYGRIHAKLKPYLQQLSLEAQNSGFPFVRPLFFHYPAQKESYQQNYTFLLGEELLVVPDIRLPNQTTFYLPPGTWLDLQSGLVHEGGITLQRSDFKVYAKKGGPNEALFLHLFSDN